MHDFISGKIRKKQYNALKLIKQATEAITASCSTTTCHVMSWFLPLISGYTEIQIWNAV